MGSYALLSVCQSVCNLTKIQTGKKFISQKVLYVEVNNFATLVHLVDETRVLIKVHETGRWAHINVKLFHVQYEL